MTWMECFHGKEGPVLWGKFVTVFGKDGYKSGVLTKIDNKQIKIDQLVYYIDKKPGKSEIWGLYWYE
jgi:hypothetical protein